jgi:predicted metal-dependent hydrolase
MPKKSSQMQTRQDKSKKDKYKIRIEQFKNKEFSTYFEKKINSYRNDKSVNIYNIGIKSMKSILKDIYKIEE